MVARTHAVRAPADRQNQEVPVRGDRGVAFAEPAVHGRARVPAGEYAPFARRDRHPSAPPFPPGSALSWAGMETVSQQPRPEIGADWANGGLMKHAVYRTRFFGSPQTTTENSASTCCTADTMSLFPLENHTR